MHVKVSFGLVRDELDYPPFDVEVICCAATDDADVYVVDSIPFFARQATLGDTIRVWRLESGELEFLAVIASSRRSLLRVVVYDEAEIQAVRDALSKFGCSTDLMAKGRVVAVDVPVEVNLSEVQQYLDQLEANDRLSYEEPILRHPRGRSLR